MEIKFKSILRKFMLISIFFGILFNFGLVFSDDYLGNEFVDNIYPHSNLNYINYFNNLNNSIISFQIFFDDNILNSDKFELRMYKLHNSNFTLVKTLCSQSLNHEPNSRYRKISCDIDKNINGVYLFDGVILRDNEILNSISKLIIIEKDSEIKFKFNNNSTDVYIKINKMKNINSINYYLVLNIPKKIISNLNLNNKENLIESRFNYSILKSDPLIAWNLEDSPSEINFKIKKRVDKRDLENFDSKIYSEEDFKKLNNNLNNEGFNLFNYLVVFLILLIIFLIFKPNLFKKKN